MSALLLAVVVTVLPAEGVPAAVAQRSKDVLERALADLDGKLTLRLCRTVAQMDEALRRDYRTAPQGVAAWYDHRRAMVYAGWPRAPTPCCGATA